MPYDVKRDVARCGLVTPFAVVNSETDKLHGCHRSEADAQKQQAALYAAMQREGEQRRA